MIPAAEGRGRRAAEQVGQDQTPGLRLVVGEHRVSASRIAVLPAEAVAVLQISRPELEQLVRDGELGRSPVDARLRIEIGSLARLVNRRVASGDLSPLAL